MSTIIKSLNPHTYRFLKLAAEFNAAMAMIGSDLNFAADGGVNINGPMTARDYRILSFWYAAMDMLDKLWEAKSNPSKVRDREYPIWIFTMHPNIIWAFKARKGLIHLYRYCDRDQYPNVRGVLVDLFHPDTKDAITRGQRISVTEYAQLWIDTVGSSIFKVAHELKPGQLLTWMSVDCDGSDSEHVNSRVIGKTCQAFMSWILSKYQSFLRTYQFEEPKLAATMHDALEATKQGIHHPELRPNAYRTPEDFMKDLRELSKRLQPHDQKKMKILLAAVRVLGFTGLQFQPRVNSASVWATLDALADRNGIAFTHDKAGLKKLKAKAEKLSFDGLKDPTAVWILDVFEGYREVFARTNRLSSAVIANTASTEDLEAGELLFQILGFDWVDVIPLQEDQDGMEPETILANAKKVRTTSMAGFSDTPRNCGFVSGQIRLMQAMATITGEGKAPYYGRAYHRIRGGGQLEGFLQVMGAPKGAILSLRQGDDAFRDCIAPETALRSLAPAFKRLKGGAIPELLAQVGAEAETAFRFLVEDDGFNGLWNKMAGLTKQLVITCRPASRSKDGSSGGDGWDASRAIGAVQTSLSVFSYYPHLFGAGQVLKQQKDGLRELYRNEEPHVRFVIDGLKALVPQVNINHFSRLAADFLDGELIDKIGSDFWTLRNMIRYITDDQSFSAQDPPHVIRGAYEVVGVLARKESRSGSEEELLAAALHCILSFWKTSG